MGAKMITITKGDREAQIVEFSLDVWKAKGWSAKGETKTTPPPPDKNKQTTGSKESATD